jgi:hypothetical protein
MKIIVCDEHEKKAIEGLLDCLNEDDAIERFKFSLKEYYKLDEADLDYLEAALGDNMIQIDDNAYQTMINSDRFVGECAECGKVTTGITDETEGSLRLLKSLHHHPEDWKCESCLNGEFEEDE